MTISTSYAPGLYNTRRNSDLFVSLRGQLDDLQRQLSTGQRSTTYGGLGAGSTTSLNVRATLSGIDAYKRNIQDGQLRIQIVSKGMDQLVKLANDGKGDLAITAYTPGGDGRTQGQLTAEGRLRQMVDILNSEVNGRYLFSGRASDVKPLADFDAIINGDGTGDGVKTLIDERKRADLGVSSATSLYGRLTAPTVAGNSVSIAEEAGGLPFGFKLAASNSTSPGITTATSGGDPADTSFTVTDNSQVQAGQTLSVSLDLPDGTQTVVRLTATTGTAGPGQFQIGASAGATAANIGAALTQTINTEAQSTLVAASAVLAARDFFTGSTNTAPPRVVGASPETATAYGADPGKTTLRFYRGDDGAGSARATAIVRTEQNDSVGIGARANEDALANMLALLSVASTETFSSSVPTDRARYAALNDRLQTQLSPNRPVVVPPATTGQSLEDIGTQFAQASVNLDAAKVRQTERENLLRSALDEVEGISNEEAATAILNLQSRLQASYQVTSLISQLSLTNFLR